MNHINSNTKDTDDMNSYKIGILGGTFDPIHNGHLMIAKEAMKEYNLSKVYLIPTGISYMKKGVTDSYFRFEMTKLAACEADEFIASDIEIKREGNTYTCDTIQYFKEQYPNAKLHFIIGTDSLFSIEKWRNAEYIFNNCTILCATRLADDSKEQTENAEFQKALELNTKFGAEILFIHCTPMDVSSTKIRIFRKEHPNEYPNILPIPKNVAEYIYRHDLYDEDTEKIHRMLMQTLKPKRFIHTMGVADTATRLALKWECSLENVRLAALLHDCAKYMLDDAKLSLCAQYGVPVSEIEQINPELLHAKAGAVTAYETYHINQRDVLSAIFYHTTGKPSMNLTEQIIFVSDYIEPQRQHSEKLPFYRKLAMEDLNKVTAYILKDTLEYLNSKNGIKNTDIDPMTQKTYEYYKKYL